MLGPDVVKDEVERRSAKASDDLGGCDGVEDRGFIEGVREREDEFKEGVSERELAADAAVDDVAASSEKTSFLGLCSGADDEAIDAPSLGGGVDFELDGADMDQRSAKESDIGNGIRVSR